MLNISSLCSQYLHYYPCAGQMSKEERNLSIGEENHHRHHIGHCLGCFGCFKTLQMRYFDVTILLLKTNQNQSKLIKVNQIKNGHLKSIKINQSKKRGNNKGSLQTSHEGGPYVCPPLSFQIHDLTWVSHKKHRNFVSIFAYSYFYVFVFQHICVCCIFVLLPCMFLLPSAFKIMIP